MFLIIYLLVQVFKIPVDSCFIKLSICYSFIVLWCLLSLFCHIAYSLPQFLRVATVNGLKNSYTADCCMLKQDGVRATMLEKNKLFINHFINTIFTLLQLISINTTDIYSPQNQTYFHFIIIYLIFASNLQIFFVGKHSLIVHRNRFIFYIILTQNG